MQTLVGCECFTHTQIGLLNKEGEGVCVCVCVYIINRKFVAAIC